MKVVLDLVQGNLELSLKSFFRLTVSAFCSQERQQVCSAGACRQEAGEAADGAP